MMIITMHLQQRIKYQMYEWNGEIVQAIFEHLEDRYVLTYQNTDRTTFVLLNSRLKYRLLKVHPFIEMISNMMKRAKIAHSIANKFIEILFFYICIRP